VKNAEDVMIAARDEVYKGRLSVLLVLALVAINVQCVALCAVESCNGSGTARAPSPADAPPCHQHHKAPGQQAPASCSHQIVVQADAAQAPVTLVFTASVIAIDLPVEPSGAFPSLSSMETLAAYAPSPPGLPALSSTILRI
jgi:hypothetical protein